MSNRLPIIDEFDVLRPRTFGDCLRDGWGDDGTPCPWVSCGHHLAWARATGGDIGAGASAQPGDPRAVARLDEIEIDELPHTCALRVAEDCATLDAVGVAFGLTRERVRQIEAKALTHVRGRSNRTVLQSLSDDGREISRPDLTARDGTLGAKELVRRLREISPATKESGGWVVQRPAFAKIPPVRLLAGEERERRIAELRARAIGAATPTVRLIAPEQLESKKPELERQESDMNPPEKADKASGARAYAAVATFAERRGISVAAARREMKLSSSTLARLRKSGCVPALAERLEAAVRSLPEGDAARALPKVPRKPSPRRTRWRGRHGNEAVMSEPSVIRQANQRSKRASLVTRAAAQASRELVTLHDQVEQRALDAWRALCASEPGTPEHFRAIELGWALVEEADRG